MKITVDYIAQGIDPKTKHIMYQNSGPDEKALLSWFKEKAVKGTFNGLECRISKRYLVNGRPFVVTKEHFMWILIYVLAAFNLWMISK